MATNPSLTCIGDVRGLGAMVAIEIVKDRESREPDGDLASRVMGCCCGIKLCSDQVEPGRR